MDPKFLIPHEGAIYLLSAVISLLFALMVFSLFRSLKILRQNNWVLAFGLFFLVLSALYFLRLYKFAAALQQVPQWINIANSVGSGLTNSLLLFSGFSLLGPALHERLSLKLQGSRVKRVLMGSVFVAFVCGVSLLRETGDRWWVEYPDSVLSAFALIFMGYVLYQNISRRRDFLMAWVALLSSVGYAILYVTHKVTIFLIDAPDPSPALRVTIKTVNLSAYVLALAPKLGIFLAGYALMLMLSTPFEGIKRLLKGVTKADEEFLEDGGLVRSIREEFHFRKVKLYIFLPGSNDRRVALNSFPASDNEEARTPRELSYKEDSDYDRMAKKGGTYIRNREGYRYWFLRRIAEASVPIFFHNSVIGCIWAARGEGKFTEADLNNLKWIATMAAPTVQAYREMAALRKINQELAQLQIDVKEYDKEKDFRDITEKIHHVIEPLASCVSIEMGFAEAHYVHPREGAAADFIESQFSPPPEGVGGSGRDGYRQLKVDLNIAVEGRGEGEQRLGSLLFAVGGAEAGKWQVAVGTNSVFRRVLSGLMADTLLDFIRGYLNYLNDKLGVQLGNLKGGDVEKWHRGVEEKAGDAGLLWVVAKDPERDKLRIYDLLGEPGPRQLVEKLEGQGQQQKWVEKDKFGLYTLGGREQDAWCVVRRVLPGSKAVLWFGVGRKGFGPELTSDYTSPWKYFLIHFCDIADSALLRIQMLQREEKQNKDMLFLSSAAGVDAESGTALHGLLNHGQALLTSSETVRAAVSSNGRAVSPVISQAISNYEKALNIVKHDLFLLAEAGERNFNRKSQLDDVIAEVCSELKGDLEESRITLKRPEPSGLIIRVPFVTAKSALETILVNAKEALEGEEGEKPRQITIDVKPQEGMVFCDITDNGPGVPKELRKTLLYEVTVSSKENSHGVGLLYSKISLIKCGGDGDIVGDIILLDQGEEPGATFRVVFPT